MKTYSPNIAAMRKKVKKAHKKNRFVGLLYLLGTLALIVLAFLPCLKIKFADGGEDLSILNFYKALGLAFQGNIAALLVFLLYLVMVVILLAEFFRIFSQFRRVMKKNDRNVNACNRNLSAMEKMGDMFSFVFTTVVIINFLVYIITPTIGDMVVERNQTIFNMTGYIFLAVGLAIHFIAGTIGGTSTLFIVGVGVEERKRTDSVLVFLFRNLIQVVATAAIVYFVTPVLTLHHFFADFAITDIVAFALQVVAVILIVVLIKHAMGTIEYNLMGMDAFGIQRTAVFALLTGLVCVGAFILDKNTAVDPPEMIFNYLFAAIAGVVCFVLNMLIFPREKKEKEPEETRDWKEVKEPEKPQVEEKKQPVTVGQLTGLPTSIDLNLVIPKNRCPDDCKVANIGVATTKYEVVCPTCGKKLSVKQASYHRCPSCGKVFQLNIGKIGKTRPEGLEEEPKKGKKVKKEKKAKKTAPAKPVLTEELSFDA